MIINKNNLNFVPAILLYFQTEQSALPKADCCAFNIYSRRQKHFYELSLLRTEMHIRRGTILYLQICNTVKQNGVVGAFGESEWHKKPFQLVALSKKSFCISAMCFMAFLYISSFTFLMEKFR